jgi:hypothetical protein
MKIEIKGLDNELKKLKAEIDKVSKTELQKEANMIVTQLVMATPVDTGLARESWTSKEGKNKIIIENDVPYIEHLNNGSSKQAPSHFVEQIALQHGKPLGAIVTVK